MDTTPLPAVGDAVLYRGQAYTVIRVVPALNLVEFAPHANVIANGAAARRPTTCALADLTAMDLPIGRVWTIPGMIEPKRIDPNAAQLTHAEHHINKSDVVSLSVETIVGGTPDASPPA